MKNKFIIILILGIFLISFVSSDCTVTFDKESYVQGETASADMVCASGENSKDYVLNWTYANGTQLEIDEGKTPATIGEHFYETYIISSTHPAGVYFNATLTGVSLEGNDSANVTEGSANSLVITEMTVGGGWMGLASSFKATIKDEFGKKITGGECHVNIRDNADTNTLIEMQARPVGGEMTQHWVLYYNQFKEAKSYVVHINCYCGLNGTTDACIDEDGLTIANSIGEATVPFTTNEWITFNDDELPIIYSNGTDYPNPVVFAGFDNIYWHRNVSNNYGYALKTTVSTYLINNATGKIYGNVNEGTTYIPERTFDIGNSTAPFDHLISQTTPTGVYYIRSFFNVFYQNQLVANYIVNTETFNVTALEDTYINHNVEARTFDLAVVNMSTVTQTSTVTPIDGSVTYLTSGELGEFCINSTNNYPGAIYTELSEMNLYNPTTGHTFDLSEKATARAQEKAVGTNWLCYSMQIPKEVQEHSDWQFHYTVRIGKYGDIFNCGDECNFELDTEYFWIREEAGRFEVVSDVNHPAIRYFGNWKFFEETIDSITRDYFKTEINLTELHEYDLDPNEKIVDDAWTLYAIYTDKMPCTTELYNYSVLLANGSVADNNVTAKELQWFKNGNLIERCAIGIEDINLSDSDDDYFEIKVWYANYEERQTLALEGIENKTGTFHLGVNCPSTGTIGSNIDCTITAYVEDLQIMQKEVDFTCYISDGIAQYSSINFNQMITRNALSMRRSFAVPSTFISGQQYVLQCHADYYNLGSRRDSFYDTFTATTISGGGGGAGITGEVIGGEEEGEEEGEDNKGDKGIGEILDKFNPFSPHRNWAFMFAELIILIGIIILIYFFIKKKRKNKRYYSHHNKSDWSKIIKKVFAVMIILLIISLVAGGIFYGYGIIKDSVQGTSTIEQTTISGMEETSYLLLKGNLTKSIFLIFLAVLIISLIIIIFTIVLALVISNIFNIRGEIKFGHDYFTHRHHEDKKSTRLQQKLNQIMLKDEIKKATLKEDYKVRKMTPTEFKEFVNRKKS